VPDITFEQRLALRVGELELELHAAPGGETVDSCVVWLPQHGVALLSNLFGPLFPHFPNFNTLRGDRYRLAEPYLANVRRVRELAPRLLITGRHLPIEGAELIDASLARLHDAVEYVYGETVARINAGQDVHQMMREVQLPAALRVGQGYGKVSWAVRTIFESYTGWFQRRATSELYADAPEAVLCDLVVPNPHRSEARRLGHHLTRRVARVSGADYILRIDGRPVTVDPFLRIPRTGPILTFRALTKWLPPRLGRWDVTMGDIELF